MPAGARSLSVAGGALATSPPPLVSRLLAFGPSSGASCLSAVRSVHPSLRSPHGGGHCCCCCCVVSSTPQVPARGAATTAGRHDGSSPPWDGGSMADRGSTRGHLESQDERRSVVVTRCTPTCRTCSVRSVGRSHSPPPPPPRLGGAANPFPRGLHPTTLSASGVSPCFPTLLSGIGTALGWRVGWDDDDVLAGGPPVGRTQLPATRGEGERERERQNVSAPDDPHCGHRIANSTAHHRSCCGFRDF